MSFKQINPLWRLHDHYTVRQAAALIAEYDPTAVDASGEYFHDPETGLTDSVGIAGISTAFSALITAIQAGTLKARIQYQAVPRYVAGIDNYIERTKWRGEDVHLIELPDGEDFVIDEQPDWGLTLVSRDDLIAWLTSRGFRSGFFFSDAEEAPDYLNPEHPRYSAKLAAAVKVWQAMEDENLLSGRSAPDAMSDWLTSRYRELGLVWNGEINKTGIGEVAKVANWQTNGGSPKTPMGD
jgi:hypothetical protein